MQDERLLVVGLDQPGQVILLIAGSMCVYWELLNTRKNRSSRTSMLDGWISRGVVRIEGEAPGVDHGTQVTVGQQHGGEGSVRTGCADPPTGASVRWDRLYSAAGARFMHFGQRAGVVQWQNFSFPS